MSTPLHLAAKKNNTEIIKILLQNGANNKLRDSNKMTPRMISKALKHSETVELFKSKSEKTAEKYGLVWNKRKMVYPTDQSG